MDSQTGLLGKEKVHLVDLQLRIRAADAMADAIAALVALGWLDARSRPADALLDYRNPPFSEDSSKIAAREKLLDDARKIVGDLANDLQRIAGPPPLKSVVSAQEFLCKVKRQTPLRRN